MARETREGGGVLCRASRNSEIKCAGLFFLLRFFILIPPKISIDTGEGPWDGREKDRKERKKKKG